MASLLEAGLDWDVLVELADEHGVQGLLTQRLQKTGFQHVPAKVRERLQSRMRAQLIFTLSMTAELFRVLEDFSKAGIETILVKGPLVSLLAYGDPAVRSFVDLDLIVRHEQILEASRRMVALGFEADVPEAAIVAGKIPGEYLFTRPGTKQLIELHTERTFRYYPKAMRIADLYTRKRQVLLDGRKVPGLSLEDELVLNCIHGTKHFWERLMLVADVAAMVARHPQIDWNKARKWAEEVGAARMLRAGLQLGAMALGAEVPEAMAEEVKRDGRTKSLCGQVARWLPQAGYSPPALLERAMFRVNMGGGGIAGAGYLFRLSLSPTEEDWEEGAEERRSWLWDALRRPFRLIRKYGQGQ